MSASAVSRPASPRGFLRKWSRIFSVFVQDALMYRAVAIVWILTETLPSAVMPLIWRASYHGKATIGGFDPWQMTAYYLIMLLVSNFITCHVMWEMATDIKEGRFSAFLLRPFSYLAYQYLGFLSWRIMRTVMFVPLALLLALLFGGVLHWGEYHPSGWFFLALLLGHFVSFAITYPFGLLALYFVETRSLFNFWYIPLVIFNGQVAPLALFPEMARRFAEFLPFRYTVAFPTELFLGRLSPDQVYHGLLMQAFWIVVGYVASVLLWKQGLKRFTGVGL